MYALKNKVQLIGNLGANPEIKTLEGGRKLARFSVATNETYRNAKGDKVTDTQWHTLIAWGKVAEIAEKYLKKGSEVAVEGKLINRSYNDKDGNKKYITEIVAENIRRLDKREGGPSEGGQSQSSAPQQEYSHSESKPASNIDDDLPF